MFFFIKILMQNTRWLLILINPELRTVCLLLSFFLSVSVCLSVSVSVSVSVFVSLCLPVSVCVCVCVSVAGALIN